MEEYTLSFSSAIEMGIVVIIIIINVIPAQSPALLVHPISRPPCLDSLQAQASVVPGVPLSALPLNRLHHAPPLRALPLCTPGLNSASENPVPPRPPRPRQRPPVAAGWVSLLLARTPLAPALPALPLSLYLTP